MDFEVYHFLDREHKILFSAYAGNHPDCPQLDLDFNCDDLSEGSGRMNDRKATRGHQVSREGVLLLAQDSPALLHFWYSELSPQQAALADSIIDSFR